jgi:hypothetical protein
MLIVMIGSIVIAKKIEPFIITAQDTSRVSGFRGQVIGIVLTVYALHLPVKQAISPAWLIVTLCRGLSMN